MTTPYLELCTADGSLSAVFLNGTTLTSYFLESGSWIPGISASNPNVSLSPAGDTIYLPVDEELSIIIRGTSAADCYTKLRTLTKLLEQAEQHSRGGNVSPVLLKYAPFGSTTASAASPYQTRVYGRTDSDKIGGVQFDQKWDSVGFNYHMKVRLRFSRVGAWLLGSDTAFSTVSYCVPSSAVFSGTANALSPTSVSVQLETGVDGLLILAPNGYIQRIDATNFTASLGTTATVADASAVGGSVARWTISSGIAQMVAASSNFVGFSTAPRLIDVYATVKPSASNMMVQASLTTNGDNRDTTVQLAVGSTDYHVLFLGTVAPPLTSAARTYTQLVVTITGTTGTTIDVDSIYLIGRSTNTSAMQLNLSNRSATTRETHTIDPNLLGRPIVEGTSGTVATYAGQFPMTDVAELQLVYLMTGSTTVSGKNSWRPYTSAVSFQTVRTYAHLVPV